MAQQWDTKIILGVGVLFIVNLLKLHTSVCCLCLFFVCKLLGGTTTACKKSTYYCIATCDGADGFV